jgi:hypothetical protein
LLRYGVLNLFVGGAKMPLQASIFASGIKKAAVFQAAVCDNYNMGSSKYISRLQMGAKPLSLLF